MSALDLAPMVEASALTIGFFFIHGLRRHAGLIGTALGAVAFMLLAAVLVTAEVRWGVAAPEFPDILQFAETAGV